MRTGVITDNSRFSLILSFFILFCLLALIVPVSAMQYAANQSADPVSLTVTGSPGGQNALKNVQGSMIIPLKKEGNTSQIFNPHSRDKIGTINVRKGTAPNIQEHADVESMSANNLSTIEILDQNNTVIYTKRFSYQNLITVPMKYPGQSDDQVPSLITANSETTVVLPFIEGGRKIRIIDDEDQIGDSVELEDMQITYQVTNNLDQLSAPPPSDPGSFNVLILASGYSAATIGNFNTKAGLIKQQLLTTAPFASYSPAISVNIFPDTQDLGCYSGCNGIDRLMCCDSSKVISAADASGSLYDEIIVIDNTATYSGGGMREGGTLAYKTNSYSTFCQVYDGQYTVPMALHEFGHSFGDLCDEYSYGSEGYSYHSCVNCRATCSDWSSYSGICTLGCDAKGAFFRPRTQYNARSFISHCLQSGQYQSRLFS